MLHGRKITVCLSIGLLILCTAASGWGQPQGDHRDRIYQPGNLKPIDSTLKIAVGDTAPDFTLPAVSGRSITLSQYRNHKNVVLSFIPAAWTPVCSDQWPGYNLAQSLFTDHDAILLGISVDNIPTLFAWTSEFGELWFEVLSDFWPHGAIAQKLGVLRSDGMAERALFVIDKKGITRYAQVGDINMRPFLEDLAAALEELD